MNITQKNNPELEANKNLQILRHPDFSDANPFEISKFPPRILELSLQSGNVDKIYLSFDIFQSAMRTIMCSDNAEDAFSLNLPYINTATADIRNFSELELLQTAKSYIDSQQINLEIECQVKSIEEMYHKLSELCSNYAKAISHLNEKCSIEIANIIENKTYKPAKQTISPPNDIFVNEILVEAQNLARKTSRVTNSQFATEQILLRGAQNPFDRLDIDTSLARYLITASPEQFKRAINVYHKFVLAATHPDIFGDDSCKVFQNYDENFKAINELIETTSVAIVQKILQGHLERRSKEKSKILNDKIDILQGKIELLRHAQSDFSKKIHQCEEFVKKISFLLIGKQVHKLSNSSLYQYCPDILKKLSNIDRGSIELDHKAEFLRANKIGLNNISLSVYFIEGFEDGVTAVRATPDGLLCKLKAPVTDFLMTAQNWKEYLQTTPNPEIDTPIGYVLGETESVIRLNQIIDTSKHSALLTVTDGAHIEYSTTLDSLNQANGDIDDFRRRGKFIVGVIINQKKQAFTALLNISYSDFRETNRLNLVNFTEEIARISNFLDEVSVSVGAETQKFTRENFLIEKLPNGDIFVQLKDTTNTYKANLSQIQRGEVVISCELETLLQKRINAYLSVSLTMRNINNICLKYLGIKSKISNNGLTLTKLKNTSTGNEFITSISSDKENLFPSIFGAVREINLGNYLHKHDCEKAGIHLTDALALYEIIANAFDLKIQRWSLT